jgi:hypothetical protein
MPRGGIEPKFSGTMKIKYGDCFISEDPKMFVDCKNPTVNADGLRKKRSKKEQSRKTSLSFMTEVDSIGVCRGVSKR